MSDGETGTQNNKLPSGVYFTVLLLLVVAVFGAWLIGAYPGKSSQRSVADECEAFAERQYETKHDDKATAQPPPTIEQNKTQPPENSGDKADQQMETERQIAKYNCHLAIYTRDVASFTKWLVYATIGLGAIGGFKGFSFGKALVSRPVRLMRQEMRSGPRKQALMPPTHMLGPQRKRTESIAIS